MNEITYLDAIKEAKNNGQKPAKISQLKLTTLSGKYHAECKKIASVVQNIPSAPVATVEEAPVVVSTPVAPVIAPSVSVNPPTNNYQEVVNQFSMTIYKNNFDAKPLVGAKKLRVADKVKTNTKKMSLSLGNTEIVDTVVVNTPVPNNVVNVPTKEPVMEEIPNIPTPPVNNILEQPKVETPLVVNEVNTKETSAKSVDDYLQKGVPNQENGVIVQLAGDVQKLKEQTEERTALLEELERKYNELKSKREQRIRDLEEEKLSYTATLEGLTERIRNLQDAIMQEEQGA